MPGGFFVHCSIRHACRVRKLRHAARDVLVNDTAETITAQNTSITGCRRRCSRAPRLRWRQRQRSMRPVPVVVIDEHLKDPLEVLLVQNQ